MKRVVLFATLFSLGMMSSQSMLAQEISHKQADNFANWLVVDGQYAKAAGLYADAYKERARGTFAYQAAELYFFVKDYSKAANFYEAATKFGSEFPDAQLKLAHCYKRMAMLDEAALAYEKYARSYVAADSAVQREKIKTEVKGIDLARAELTRVDPTIFVDKLGGSVNSMKNEIAPFVAGNTILFISDFDGTMRAYSSTKGREGWSQMRPAPELPVIDGGHIGGGTLVTPDRYVFSFCVQQSNMAQPAVPCRIQEVTKVNGKWGKPKDVPGSINAEGSSSNHPFVFIDGDKEVMLFSSDRPNGQGGMDIWRAERSTADASAPYGAPVNLGVTINSPGNEVTPFWNAKTKTLSYASDAGITMGGYDIWQATAKDNLANFNTPRNPGTPINSSADDYHYFEVAGESRAFFSSNRSADMTRTNLNNEDIFVVTYDNPNILTEFAVLDDETGRPISDPTITVMVNPDGLQRKPLLAQRSLNGTYSLMLPVERDIDIEISRPYCQDHNVSVYIPSGERDGYKIAAARLRRTPTQKGDVEVVAGLRIDHDAPAQKKEVMTASGDEEESKQ